MSCLVHLTTHPFDRIDGQSPSICGTPVYFYGTQSTDLVKQAFCWVLTMVSSVSLCLADSANCSIYHSYGNSFMVHRGENKTVTVIPWGRGRTQQ